MSLEFSFCPNCSKPLSKFTESGRTRSRCDYCGYVHYMNPAPAAGVLVLEEGKVLLVKRRFDPYRGQWVMPSGYIEYDEDIAVTAVREVREETGLDVELDSVHAVESCFDDPRGNTVLVLYEGHVKGGVLKAGDDAEEAGFFPLDDLPPIAFEVHREILGKLGESGG